MLGQLTITWLAEANPMRSSGGRTWNDAVLVTLPFGVKMVIGPEMASGGTMAVMRRSRLLVSALVKLALAPLKRTAVVPVKFVPVGSPWRQGFRSPGKTVCR